MRIISLCDPHSVILTEATKPELKVVEQVEEAGTYVISEPKVETKKQTLLDISKELESLEDLISSLDDLDGQASIDLDEAIKELFSQHQSVTQDFNNKVDNYLAVIREQEHWAAGWKNEAKRLDKLAEVATKKAEFLQERLKKVLESMEIGKLKTNRFNLSICKNGGKTPIIFDDTDPKTVPSQYQRVIYEFDKESIRKALDSGETLDFASFSERGTHLRVK